MPTFGERLQELREQKGVTQQQLADASSVNLWTIRGYEQGRREPGWRVAIDLAAALGVAVEAFADCISQEAGEPPPNKGKGRPRKDASTAATPSTPPADDLEAATASGSAEDRDVKTRKRATEEATQPKRRRGK